MDKKYLAKIIAKDSQGLKLISACCFKAKVKIEELKYLKKNQIFLIFLQRFKLENEKNRQKILFFRGEISILIWRRGENFLTARYRSISQENSVYVIPYPLLSKRQEKHIKKVQLQPSFCWAHHVV